jgi:hypothetical protein
MQPWANKRRDIVAKDPSGGQRHANDGTTQHIDRHGVTGRTALL